VGRDKRIELAERAADVALAAMPVPLRVLDVGCGVGDLLAEMVVRAPYCEAYVGVDDAANVTIARGAADRRITFVCAAPDSLPFTASSFDLVLASNSFDTWPDQGRGVAELARVLAPSGTIVIIDHTRRASGAVSERAHSAKALSALLDPVGLRLQRREPLLRSAFAVAAAQAVVVCR
jgi:tocopherol O-methyltransferase